MWKWLILILVGYALYRMFMNDRKKSGGKGIIAI